MLEFFAVIQFFSKMANRKITSLNSVVIKTGFTLQLGTDTSENLLDFRPSPRKLHYHLPNGWISLKLKLNLKLITLMVNFEIDLNNFF